MKFGWIEIVLLVLATVVATLGVVWTWAEFKTWRINRLHAPDRRKPHPRR